MLAEVKKCIQNHDIKGLRYLFADSLDVDPTFEKYREEYEYCKNVDGLFAAHQELSGLSDKESDWTLSYWDQLKDDLVKNFSKTRFEHMIRVAKVVYAEKIERLLKERGEAKAAGQSMKAAEEDRAVDIKGRQETVESFGRVSDLTNFRAGAGSVSDAEWQQEQRLAARRKELEEENQRIEARQRAQRERIEAAKRSGASAPDRQGGDDGPKKWLGAAIIVAAVIAAVLIIVVLRSLR